MSSSSSFNYGAGSSSSNTINNNNNNNNNNGDSSSTSSDTYETPLALLEQLVYLDNFIPANNGQTSTFSAQNNTDFDEQLTAELAAFADDSFIFADEEKPKNHNLSNTPNDTTATEASNSTNNTPDSNNLSNNNNPNRNIPSTISELLASSIYKPNASPFQQQQAFAASRSQSQIQANGTNNNNNNLPKVDVPQGAQSTLSAAGLTQTQIDALATLIAFHKTEQSGQPNKLNGLPQQTQQQPQQQSLLSKEQNFTEVNSNGDNNSQFQFNVPYSAYKTQEETVFQQPTVSASQLSVSRRTSSPAPSTASATPSDSGNLDATELDKKRRNTAASARFRIKKKIKEQEMERNIRELSNNASRLELKIQQLEMENKLLRNLVVEKGNQRNTEELERLKKRAKFNVEMDEDSNKTTTANGQDVLIKSESTQN